MCQAAPSQTFQQLELGRIVSIIQVSIAVIWHNWLSISVVILVFFFPRFFADLASYGAIATEHVKAFVSKSVADETKRFPNS